MGKECASAHGIQAIVVFATDRFFEVVLRDSDPVGATLDFVPDMSTLQARVPGRQAVLLPESDSGR